MIMRRLFVAGRSIERKRELGWMVNVALRPVQMPRTVVIHPTVWANGATSVSTCVLRKDVGQAPGARYRREQERYHERAATVIWLTVIHGDDTQFDWLLAEELGELLVCTLPRFLPLE
jgi:hypothetical protein